MRRVKILVDVAMYGLFLYLMSYHAGQGLFRHGVLGCILLALFFLHHGLNWKWYRSLGRGRYTLARIGFLSVDLLLLAAMVLMALSSIQMSGHVFAFSPFFGTRTARSLHTVSTAWGFVLTALHMGLHTRALFAKLGRRAEKRLPPFLRRTLFFLLLAVGCAAFWHSGLWKNLFLLPRSGRTLEGLRFYADYLLLTLAACQWVYLLMKPKRKT